MRVEGEVSASPKDFMAVIIHQFSAGQAQLPGISVRGDICHVGSYGVVILHRGILLFFNLPRGNSTS